MSSHRYEYFEVGVDTFRGTLQTWYVQFYDNNNVKTLFRTGYVSKEKAIENGERTIRAFWPGVELGYGAQSTNRNGSSYTAWLDSDDRIYFVDGPYYGNYPTTTGWKYWFDYNKKRKKADDFKSTQIIPITNRNSINTNSYSRGQSTKTFDEKWREGIEKFLDKITLDVSSSN